MTEMHACDLISKQAALDALDEQIRWCDKALSTFDIPMKDEYAVKVERASLVAFRETLEYIPTADAALVVRCKDCKHSHMTVNGECKYCDIWFPDEAEYMDGDYYCASGERKDED